MHCEGFTVITALHIPFFHSNYWIPNNLHRLQTDFLHFKDANLELYGPSNMIALLPFLFCFYYWVFFLFWSVSHKPKMSRKTASSFLNVTPVFDVNVHSAKQLRQFIYTSLSIIPSLLDSGSFSSKVCILPLNNDLHILKNHNNKNNVQFRTELSIL